MGFPKALLSLDGTPLWQFQATALSAVCTHVCVVLGWNGAAVAQRQGSSIQIIASPAWWREEPIETVRHGLRALPAGDVLILPVDVPAPNRATMEKIAATPGDVVAHFNGNKGHPVRICDKTRLRILNEQAPNGLRSFLSKAQELSVDDPGTLLNHNRPQDWAAWLRKRSTPVV
jgi:CTP:molybdopterin cytidylyltransferase MocA